MSNLDLPMRGNLAWAALPSVDKVEVLDRFNGVPTLGLLRVGPRSYLFWRAFGYVDDFSTWVYVELSSREAARVLEAEGSDPLEGIVFDAPDDRCVCVGGAHLNRLIFEREWLLPKGIKGTTLLLELARFTLEAAQIASEHDLPATRREILERASRAVSESSAKLELAAR